MLKKVAQVFILLAVFWCQAQEGFVINSKKNKIKIPFQQINNLIFIPVTVNDIPLLFLLDSGVVETVLFSLEETEQIELYNVETISLKGLGSEEAINAYKSKGNKLIIADEIADLQHEILIVLEEDINFSNMVGFPVNGIIGYHFFKDNIIEIDYENKVLYVFKEAEKIPKNRFKNFVKIPISIEGKKPYLFGDVLFSKNWNQVKLLLDTGNSDAIWLFDIKPALIPDPKIDDFLGVGFSGTITGLRARLPQFKINNFGFENPLIAFPDAASTKNVKMAANRGGSIGAEILRRFTAVFDYNGGYLYLKMNSGYSDLFVFNRSGLEVHLKEKQWQPEEVYNNKAVKKDINFDTESPVYNLKFKMVEKPIYSISNVRQDSPAALAGLEKNDILVTINNRAASSYSLQSINNLLKANEGKKVKMEVERNGQIIATEFVLKKIL